MTRAYTLDEIEEMRKLTRELIKGPTLHWDVQSDGNLMATGGSYKESERVSMVEEYVRTYMANGTEVEELRLAVRKQRAASDAAYKAALAIAIARA
jgi:hypothetical protein